MPVIYARMNEEVAAIVAQRVTGQMFGIIQQMGKPDIMSWSQEEANYVFGTAVNMFLWEERKLAKPAYTVEYSAPVNPGADNEFAHPDEIPY